MRTWSPCVLLVLLVAVPVLSIVAGAIAMTGMLSLLLHGDAPTNNVNCVTL